MTFFCDNYWNVLEFISQDNTRTLKAEMENSLLKCCIHFVLFKGGGGSKNQHALNLNQSNVILG